jgi:hypothetical protein
MRTKNFNICLGVDRPLSHVFAQIFVNKMPKGAEDDCAPNFDSWMNFPIATHSVAGIGEAVNAVERYINAHEEAPFRIPHEMVDALTGEVLLHMREPGASLNITKHYPS